MKKKNSTNELDQIKKLLIQYNLDLKKNDDPHIIKVQFEKKNNNEYKYAGMRKAPSASKLPIPYKLLNYEVI